MTTKGSRPGTSSRSGSKDSKAAPAGKPTSKTASGFSRRGFIGGSAAGGVMVATGAEARAAAAARPKTLGPRKALLTLSVNGAERNVTVEPRVTLLRALRNHLDVTGPKEICDRGSCGGCSVLLDGTLVNACMLLAVDAVGKKITTIEGLSGKEGQLHPIQTAFVEKDALQCGFCTPGMVMACKALLDKKKDPTLVDIKRGLSGNICRCGTYTRIFAAVQAASKQV
jgi:aerobic-type carbon monoxide dehydrogenase small subunit (CoxS/CutS family)